MGTNARGIQCLSNHKGTIDLLDDSNERNLHASQLVTRSSLSSLGVSCDFFIF